MSALPRAAVLVALLASVAPTFAMAQSAGAAASGAGSSTAPANGTPSPSTLPPSGGVASGKPAIGAVTPVEKQEDAREQKDTTICKGC